MAFYAKVPTKKIESEMNGDDANRKIPDLFDGVYDICCRCG